MEHITEHASAEDAILYYSQHSEEIFPEADELTIAGTKTCPMCKSKVWLILPHEAIQAYLNGALAQQAFPFMLADQRERFITGTCPTCWENLFAFDDE